MPMMRKIEVDGTKFEWIVGKSHIRIRGNGHVVDISLRDFLQHEWEMTPGNAYELTEESYRTFRIEPSDIVTYVRKHGWLKPRVKDNKRRSA